MWAPRSWLWLLLLVELATGQPTTRSKSAVRHSLPTLPNIVLITLDTTRADRMGFLGSQRGLTPNLDALAHQGVVFTRAFSQVPLTPPSHATILTGTYPTFNHVNDFGVKLPSDVPDLPATLKARGYKTAAFVGSLILDPIEGSSPGFDRGFDTYDAGFHTKRPGQDRYKTIERRASDVVAHAMSWLNKHPRGPFFIWVHMYDAHEPYDPPEPFKSKYSSAPYDGEIAYTDSAVGTLLTYLKGHGLFDGCAIAVMADHGEALGEHGEIAHGVFLYDETVHVPLLLKLPNGANAGKQVDSRVGLVDVMPTILQVAGIAVPKDVQGESLVPLMKPASATQEAAPPVDHPVYSESDYPRRAFGWSALRSWRAGKYLFIEAPRNELYDQATDAHADHDVSATSTAVVSTLKGQLDEFRQQIRSSTEAPKTPVDPQAQAKLGALGYVAGDDDVTVRTGIKDTGADPKDKIEVVNLFHDALLLMEDTRYQDAVPLFQRILKTEPEMPLAHIQLGTAYTWLKEYDKALPALRKATELRQDNLMVHYLLGLAMFETGDIAGAVPEFQAAIDKSPKWAALHFSLAAAYARIDRLPDAQKELQTTVELDADNFRANLLLGRMLSMEGKAAAGLSNLKKAARIQPTSPEAHLFLADAYERLGQKANAARERAEAERLRGSGGQ